MKKSKITEPVTGTLMTPLSPTGFESTPTSGWSQTERAIISPTVPPSRHLGDPIDVTALTEGFFGVVIAPRGDLLANLAPENNHPPQLQPANQDSL